LPSEIVENVILVAALMAIIVGATAGAWMHIQNQNRIAEIRYASTVLTQVGDTLRGVVYGGRGMGEVKFDFKTGSLQILEDGGVFISLTIGGDKITLANVPYQYFQYKAPFQVYGSERIYDVGSEVKAYVESVAATNVVYHYSEGGNSYVILKPQVYVSSDVVGGKVSIHVYIMKILNPGASMKGVTFTVEKTTPTITLYPIGQEADVTLNVQLRGVGDVKEGNLSIQGTQPGQILEVTVNLIEVKTQWGR